MASHDRPFGWTRDEIEEHERELDETCGPDDYDPVRDLLHEEQIEAALNQPSFAPPTPFGYGDPGTANFLTPFWEKLIKDLRGEQ